MQIDQSLELTDEQRDSVLILEMIWDVYNQGYERFLRGQTTPQAIEAIIKIELKAIVRRIEHKQKAARTRNGNLEEMKVNGSKNSTSK